MTNHRSILTWKFAFSQMFRNDFGQWLEKGSDKGSGNKIHSIINCVVPLSPFKYVWFH